MVRIKGWLLAGAASFALAACGPTETAEAPAPETPAAPAVALDLTPDPADGDGGVSAFYSDPVPAGDLKPGQLIRSEILEPEKALAEAGQAFRMMYVSTDGLEGTKPVLVSGAVFLPKGEPPAGGWPLMAWAHGTVGVADVCAPSNNPRSERDTKYLNHWLSQGYAVVASDYQGLGAPGGHPYLATKPEAYSVLDSIRAVQSGDMPVSDAVVLVGQSQGGGAAFATAAVADAYAPELDIRGTVATGTPYFTATTAPATRDPDAVSPVLGYTIYILDLVRQADPAFDPADYLSPEGMKLWELSRTACYGQVARAIVDGGISQNKAIAVDTTPIASKYYGLMSYDTLKVKGPVFMGTGGQDRDVPPEGQQRLVNDACAAGSVIQHHIYPDLDHSGAVNGSLADSTPFVAKAFAGEAITGNCPTK